ARASETVPAPLRKRALFAHRHAGREQPAAARKGARTGPRQPDADRAGVRQAQIHAWRRVLDARRRDHAAPVAPRLLRHPAAQTGRAADEIRRAPVLAAGVYRGADQCRTRDAQVTNPSKSGPPNGGLRLDTDSSSPLIWVTE